MASRELSIFIAPKGLREGTTRRERFPTGMGARCWRNRHSPTAAAAINGPLAGPIDLAEFIGAANRWLDQAVATRRGARGSRAAFACVEADRTMS